MPSDGSLIRLRVEPSTNELYRQRVTSPDENSNYSSWTDWSVTAYAVAICAYGTSVFAFRIGTDGHLYRSESSDSGASFGNWTDMGDISGDNTFRLAACFKDSDEAIVLYADGTDIYRRRYDGTASPTWVSPTGHIDDDTAWINETNAYDEDVGTVAYTTTSSYLRLTHPEIPCNKVRVMASVQDAGYKGYDPNVTVGVYYGGAWHQIHTGVIAMNQWYEISVGGKESITEARVKITNQVYRNLVEFDFEQDNTWESAAAWTNSMNSINGLAVTYMGDWNIVVTGRQATTLKPIVCTCVLGDGYSAAVGNWSSLAELTIAASDSDIAFKFPCLDMPDVFRAFFVEAYSGSEPYNRPYWTY